MPRPLVGKLRLELRSCLAGFAVSMSEYYRKLDAVAQSRYSGKLKLLGLEEKDDPYEASNSTTSSAICTTACYDHVHTLLRFIT